MSPRTVYAALELTAGKYPNAPALQQPLGKGKYQRYTYKEYQQAVPRQRCKQKWEPGLGR